MGLMSAADFLQYVSQAVYLLVFLFTFVRAARRPTRSNVDIASFFGAAALAIAVTWIDDAFHVLPSGLFAALSMTVVMALPYLLLRLADDFGRVPAPLQRMADVGLALIVVGLVTIRPPMPLEFVGVLVLYFVGLSLCDAIAFIQAARRANGVTRRRMQAIAVGTLSLGFDVLLVGIQAGLPAAAPITALVGSIAGLGSAIAYFVGIVPPRWLRHAWQAPEFRAFVRQTSRLPTLPEHGTLLRQLEQSAAEAVGAPNALIQLWDPDARVLRCAVEGRSFAYPLDRTVCGRAFQSQKSIFARHLVETNSPLGDLYQMIHADAALIAPITSNRRRFGVLALYSPRDPIFADDDLDLVQLLADQIAVVLENQVLVEEAIAERARAKSLEEVERKNAEIQELNARLEQRVAERTAELRAAMAELESFSYSVSHDLRAPLRTIDGFSLALVEDFGSLLGPEGRDFLDRIRAASQRMGDLIDGLLRLSRVTRSELNWESVDLSAMARGIAADLQRTQPDRAATFLIEDGLVAQGDALLLRVALDNLLGNAWKFTAPRPDARIEFGREERNGRDIYVVRDNGAGFDMTFADKLFGPFQRLHGRTEFEGTGIGLATVQRIIRRHGGHVWGEGEVGRGAAFYFTLGTPVEAPAEDRREPAAAGIR